MASAKLSLSGIDIELPVILGTEDEVAIDCTKLRSTTSAITYDPGYGNTGSCKSSITFIDGEKGILRYRGYAIEELAENLKFPSVAYLLIHGELPTKEQKIKWRSDLTRHSFIHEGQISFFNSFPVSAHPMNILSAMISTMTSFYPEGDDGENIELSILRLIGQVKTIAAYSYKKSIGEPFLYPIAELDYSANFLRMMFGMPSESYEVPKIVEKALDMLLILHADHEQNCSTAAVRMVGSSEANIYASMSTGVNALWGRLHGGANQAVLEMLERIHQDGGGYKKYIELAKNKNSDFRLMGFGHRVYKNFDPRAIMLRKACDKILEEMGINDPLLDIAKNIESAVLKDDYFVERKLYPNVDFYSGVIYHALGIPTDMFTVLFAMGRMPGWIAHWLEMREDPDGRIHRPRQVYIGPQMRHLVT